MDDDADSSAFYYRGRFLDFLGLTITNLLLTLATLGIYRFWATARERRFLWSRTFFIDDAFEWTGSGRELFLGFLLALVVFTFPFTILYLALQGLVLRDQPALAGALTLAIFVLLAFLRGFATFRGLRYRLARTSWHGISGGGTGSATRYGLETLWRGMITYLTLFVMHPWTQTRLWRSRWRQMYFGSSDFASDPRWTPLMFQYLLLYIGPLLIFGLPALLVFATVAGGGRISMFDPDNQTIALLALLLAFAFYLLWSIMMLAYYARYLREAVSTMTLGALSFDFTATTGHWLRLIIGNFALLMIGYLVGLVPLAMLGVFAEMRAGITLLELLNHVPVLITLVLTLAIPVGLAGAIARYRRWRFYVRHLHATGEIDIPGMTQREGVRMRQGEGLLDALDMGAI